MRNFLACTVILILGVWSFPLTGAVKANGDYSYVLKRHVKNGVPVYKTLSAEGKKRLNKYLGKMTDFDLEQLKTENQKKAFWINAYNAFAMKLVMENYPQNDEIFKVEGFFDLKKIRIAGREMSLSNISSDELLLGHTTKDPRINFALFNGTESSPRLRREPFDPDKMDSELDECTRNYVQDKNNVFLDKKNKVPDPSKVDNIKPEQYDKLPKDFTKLSVSPVFRWFQDDFENHSGSVIDFIVKYLRKEDAQYIKRNAGKIVLDYLPYNWSFAGFKK